MATPKRIKTLRIAEGATSGIYDYRSFTSPNGGIINLRACVHHIPVMHQQTGIADISLLRSPILTGQGLMVQFSTDDTGNIGLFTRANRLCYHARGGNQLTCGIEHMHYLTSEAWAKKQMRAAAWIAQYLEREFNIPLQMANVEAAGGPFVAIVRKGHTSHEMISKCAGYNDRSDPGRGFDYEYMFKAAEFFKRHGHFIGA